MCLVRAEVAAVLSIIISISFYRCLCDSSDTALLREYDLLEETDQWSLEEDKLFYASGICASENRSYVEKCGFAEKVDNLHTLQRARCFCDDACHIYHDCCINYVLRDDSHSRNWTCREVRGQDNFRFPIYVLQVCPEEWGDLYTRSMCETESSDMDKNGGPYSYLQDIPVKSESSGIFYRNVFCALCNGESNFVKWKSYFYCSSDVPNTIYNKKDIDFSESFYNTRTHNFRYAKIGGNYTNCRLVVEDFNRHRVLSIHGARLCKPMISTCHSESDDRDRQGCNSYTSFVYEMPYLSRKRKVYKNFHCALCNKANVGRIRCLDPQYPIIMVESEPTVAASLSFLFDFNFEGGDEQIGVTSPCKLNDGKIWDPVLKQCTSFTCGALFERKGSVCVPRATKENIGGLNSSCPKMILSRNVFQITENGSVFLNNTGKLLSLSEYESFELDGKEIISIAVCAEEGSFLLNLSNVQYYLSEITLSLSIICLVLHLFVYSVLEDLRNCPGKILMSLSACLLCGHTFLLIGPHAKNSRWMCYMSAVLTHFGYLSSFLWMNIMAYDIYRTFSETQSRNSMKKYTFVKYSSYCWITSLTITSLSILFDNTLPVDSKFRPKYGNPICWFNQRKGLLIFFILPIFSLLLINVIYFTIASFRINKISQQTKMVNNFPDRVRYFLYIKLSVVFGLTWLLGILAGILRVEFLWYPFIVFNGLQGVFIFISFTVKRKISKMLLIKFKIHSDSYQMGKSRGLKQTMYSSLSNLSTMQTTLTAHLPALNENPQILKAVRKINPDLLVNDKKV